jgi:hypothetical protein
MSRTITYAEWRSTDSFEYVFDMTSYVLDEALMQPREYLLESEMLLHMIIDADEVSECEVMFLRNGDDIYWLKYYTESAQYVEQECVECQYCDQIDLVAFCEDAVDRDDARYYEITIHVIPPLKSVVRCVCELYAGTGVDVRVRQVN